MLTLQLQRKQLKVIYINYILEILDMYFKTIFDSFLPFPKGKHIQQHFIVVGKTR